MTIALYPSCHALSCMSRRRGSRRRTRRLDRPDVDLNLVTSTRKSYGWRALRTRWVTHLPLVQSKPTGDAGRRRSSVEGSVA